MSNYNNITARWDRGTLSETIISRQFDDAATLVAFAGVPTGDDDEDAVYHLIVWMATEEGGEPHEQAPILLDAPEWLISNFYTQFTQVIRFQLCIQTEGGAYEAHSPIFSGRIARSLRHDGTTDDINTSVLFDPYKKYVDEKAMAAGAVVIDSDLDTSSTNPVQNKIVAGAIAGLNGRLDGLGDGVPTEVRQALLTLFQSAAYAETGLTDEIAVIASWAAVVTAISLNQSSISISGASTNQLVATTTPAGGAVIWASSDTSVATVSSNGLVTGVGNGTAIITASSGGKKATCSVTVSGFASLTGITATYTQPGTVWTTDTLDSLKTNLVVTANYSDSTTRTLSDSDYTLSGTLEVGTSTITVSYGGKTATFDVEVTGQNILAGIRTADMSVTGLTKEATNRAVTNMIRVTGGQSISVTSSAFYVRLMQYDINKGFLPNATDIGDMSASTATGTLDASCAYIRVLMKKSDDSDFTEQELLASTLTIDGVSWNLSRTTEANGTFTLKVAKRGVSSTTGDYTESSIRVSTDMMPVRRTSNVVIATTSGEYLKAWTYKSDGTFGDGQGTLNTTSITVSITSTLYFLIITFKKSDNSDFTDADMLAITGTINGVPFVVEESSV